MKPSTYIKPGVVVQIAPTTRTAFAACFMTVTEVKPWGAQGFVAIPQGMGDAPGGAYVRIGWDDMELVGMATWIPATSEGASDV